MLTTSLFCVEGVSDGIQSVLCLCGVVFVCLRVACVCACGGGVRVCIECVSVLQCPITLHIPTCSHIKYVPLPTRVCVCVCMCIVCVRGVRAKRIIIFLRHCRTHVLYFLCPNTSIWMTSNVFPYYFFFLPTTRRGTISQHRVSLATLLCFLGPSGFRFF